MEKKHFPLEKEMAQKLCPPNLVSINFIVCLFIHLIVFLCRCVHMCTCVVAAREGLKSQMLGNDPIWVLEIECGPSRKPVHAVNHVGAWTAHSYMNSLFFYESNKVF